LRAWISMSARAATHVNRVWFAAGGGAPGANLRFDLRRASRYQG
jgi:hypothetical protein